MIHVIARYRSLSAPVKASLWFTACNIVQRGISLLTVPIFTRMLTAEQYGEYTVFQSWYSIIVIVATLQLAAGVYMKGLSKYEDDQDAFTSSMIGLYSLNVLLCIAIYTLFRGWLNEAMGMTSLYMYAIFIECLFAPALTFWSARQRYKYRYRALIAVTLGVALFSPLLGIAWVMTTEHKAVARILSYVLVQVAFGAFFYFKQLKSGKRVFSRDYWTYALAFNIPLIPHYLSQIVLSQADRIMISNMVGKEAAAIYGVAYTLALTTNIVMSAITSSYTPYTYQSLKAGQPKRLESVCLGTLLLVAAMLVGVMVVGPELTKVVASEKYYEARWIIPPVAVSAFFMYFYNLFATVEFYYDKTKFTMVITCVSAAINVAANYLLIGTFGYIAAAYTTLGCYLLIGVAHYTYARLLLKRDGIDDFVNTKYVVPLSLGLLTTMGLLISIYDLPAIRYSVLVLLAAVLIVKRRQITSIARSLVAKQ